MAFKQKLSLQLLRLFGWRAFDLPDRPAKAVIVGYPHTSNWDFPIGILAMWTLRLRARWAGKDSLFFGPMGPLMRALGGLPVNRRERTGLVQRLADEFAQEKELSLVITPEGTRALTPGWKSGFYRVAMAAGVPILLGAIDYSKKEIGIVARFDPTGDEDADMATITRHYQGIKALRPELASPIRLLK
jgi:1-acyl-sn-glycerol-3-phosphate acyltransferase